MPGPRRLARVAVATALALLLVAWVIAATASLAELTLVVQQNASEECPSLSSVIHPSAIHVEPGILRHQNWIEFPVPRRFAGTYALCLDNRVLSTGAGDLDFRAASGTFNLSTRAVDLYWLVGDLDGLRDPSRWELKLECVSNYPCG